ncbi:MAG: caspase family protein, partial [Bacteroidota bacterium]
MAVKRKDSDGSGSRPDDGKVYALLVGINDYQNVNDLKGCIKDIDRVESFLKRFWGIPQNETGKFTNKPVRHRILPITEEDIGYDFVNILRLENTEATYQNVVEGFTKFLSQAGANDCVWFHFSGHGAQAPTATAFADLEGGKDQGLLCTDYALVKDTSADNFGQYSGMLADKELAILLDEITAGASGAPHVLVTLDCCHAGGGTRDEEILVRSEDIEDNEEEINLNRPLDTYYLGRFEEQIKAGNINFPAAPHVVMTACNNLQLAGEKNGGFFTNALITALESVPGPGTINYADLLIRTRAAVRNKNFLQTPQFEFLGGVKANSQFLQGFPAGDPDRYEVRFQNQNWVIGVGAIDGLPTTARLQSMVAAGAKPIQIEVFAVNNTINTGDVNESTDNNGTNHDADGSEEGTLTIDQKDNQDPDSGTGIIPPGAVDTLSTMEFKKSDFGVRVRVFDFEKEG